MKRRLMIAIGILALSSLLIVGYLMRIQANDPLSLFVDAYPDGAYDLSFGPFNPYDDGVEGRGSQRLVFKIHATPEDIQRFYQQALEAEGWIACSRFNLDCNYISYVFCSLHYNHNSFEHLDGYFHPSLIDPFLTHPNAALLIKSVGTTTETISLVELHQLPFSIRSSCPEP